MTDTLFPDPDDGALYALWNALHHYGRDAATGYVNKAIVTADELIHRWRDRKPDDAAIAADVGMAFRSPVKLQADLPPGLRVELTPGARAEGGDEDEDAKAKKKKNRKKMHLLVGWDWTYEDGSLLALSAEERRELSPEALERLEFCKKHVRKIGERELVRLCRALIAQPPGAPPPPAR